MTHIAIHEQLNGKVVEWIEKVSDASSGTDELMSKRIFHRMRWRTLLK